MSNEEAAPKRGPGRPSTGITPKRQVRIEDPLWDEVERLALELAREAGTVRLVRNPVTHQEREAGDVAAFVKEALRRETLRVARTIRRHVESDPFDADSQAGRGSAW